MPAGGKRRARRAAKSSKDDDNGLDFDVNGRRLEDVDEDEILEGDEVDAFHSKRDKIMLDDLGVGDDEDDDEDDELNGQDESIMEIQGEHSDDSDDDEEDDDEDYETGDNDVELNSVDGESSEDDEQISQAWGKKRDQFYNTDYVDPDYAIQQEELDIAVEEEKEALRLQSKRLTERSEEDFGLDELEELPAEQIKKLKAKDKRSQSQIMSAFNDELENISLERLNTGVNADTESIAKNLSTLSKDDRLAFIAERAPELLDLCDELTEKSEELEEVVKPALLLHAEGRRTLTPSGLEYLQLRHRLLLLYFINMGYYMYLRAKHHPTAKISVHPCIRQLVKLRNLLAGLDPIQQKFTKDMKNMEDFNAGSLSEDDEDNGTDEEDTEMQEDGSMDDGDSSVGDIDDADIKSIVDEPVNDTDIELPPTRKSLSYTEIPLSQAQKQAKSLSKIARKSKRQRAKAAADFGEIAARDDEMGMERTARENEKALKRHANAPLKGDESSRDAMAAALMEAAAKAADEDADPEMDAQAAAFLSAVESATQVKKADKKKKQKEALAQQMANTATDDGREATTDDNRGLTWAMLKNKGLTPGRKKEMRNPRIRNKNKFKKATKRRKGAILELRKETGRYSGEKFGIRTDITKGIKLS